MEQRYRRRSIVPLRSAETPWYLSSGIALSDLIAAYEFQGASSLTTAYLRVAGDGGNASLNPSIVGTGTAPTWDATNGLKFSDVSSQFLDTGIIPVAGMSAIVKFSNVTTNDAYLFGSKTAAGQSFQIVPHLGGTDNVRYGNGGEITKVPYLSEGTLGIAGTLAFRNGVQESGAMSAWSGTSTHTINLARLNRASPTGYISAYIQAIAFYRTILSPTQMSALHGAIVNNPFDPTPVESGEFMIVFMTDTHYEDSGVSSVHSRMTQYLADHAISLGISLVLHGGDVIYPPLEADPSYEWNDASSMFDNLDSINLPYLLTIGNHDYDGDNATDVIGRASTKFNTYFTQPRYTNKNWWSGGFFEAERTENSYLLRTINGVDWIFITMEFGPRSAVLTWCDNLLSTYSSRHAVIVTHSYLHRDGTTVGAADQYAATSYTLDGDRSNGDTIWNMLKTHDNVRLVLSGHDKGTIGWASAHRQDNSDGGIPITQVVANFQSYFNYGSGMMQFIRIHPDNKTIKVQTFSPYLGMFMHDSANEYTVSWT